MRRVIAVRSMWMVAILLGVSFVAFVLMRALPGDFAWQRRAPRCFSPTCSTQCAGTSASTVR